MVSVEDVLVIANVDEVGVVVVSVPVGVGVDPGVPVGVGVVVCATRLRVLETEDATGS